MLQSTLSGNLIQDPLDDTELLHKLYHEQGLTLRQLGDE